jgi:hypothetical protein
VCIENYEPFVMMGYNKKGVKIGDGEIDEIGR